MGPASFVELVVIAYAASALTSSLFVIEERPERSRSRAIERSSSFVIAVSCLRVIAGATFAFGACGAAWVGRKESFHDPIIVSICSRSFATWSWI